MAFSITACGSEKSDKDSKKESSETVETSEDEAEDAVNTLYSAMADLNCEKGFKIVFPEEIYAPWREDMGSSYDSLLKVFENRFKSFEEIEEALGGYSLEYEVVAVEDINSLETISAENLTISSADDMSAQLKEEVGDYLEDDIKEVYIAQVDWSFKLGDKKDATGTDYVSVYKYGDGWYTVSNFWGKLNGYMGFVDKFLSNPDGLKVANDGCAEFDNGAGAAFNLTYDTSKYELLYVDSVDLIFQLVSDDFYNSDNTFSIYIGTEAYETVVGNRDDNSYEDTTIAGRDACIVYSEDGSYFVTRAKFEEFDGYAEIIGSLEGGAEATNEVFEELLSGIEF